MTVFVHSIVIICFKFLFVDRFGPTATLMEDFEIAAKGLDPGGSS